MTSAGPAPGCWTSPGCWRRSAGDCRTGSSGCCCCCRDCCSCSSGSAHRPNLTRRTADFASEGSESSCPKLPCCRLTASPPGRRWPPRAWPSSRGSRKCSKSTWSDPEHPTRCRNPSASSTGWPIQLMGAGSTAAGSLEDSATGFADACCSESCCCCCYCCCGLAAKPAHPDYPGGPDLHQTHCSGWPMAGVESGVTAEAEEAEGRRAVGEEADEEFCGDALVWEDLMLLAAAAAVVVAGVAVVTTEAVAALLWRSARAALLLLVLMLPLLQGLLETVAFSSEARFSRLVCFENPVLLRSGTRSTWRTATDSTTDTDGFAQSGRTPRLVADDTDIRSSPTPLLSREDLRLRPGRTFSLEAEEVGPSESLHWTCWNGFLVAVTSASLDGVTVVTVVAVGVARSQMATLTLVVDAGVVGTEEATGRFFDSSMLLFNAFWKRNFKLGLNSVRPLNSLS